MDGTADEIGWQLLFKAVLLQAARDAFLPSASKKDKKNALEFLKGGRDLELACDIACVDYASIVYWMKNISTNNNLNYKRLLSEIKK